MFDNNQRLVAGKPQKGRSKWPGPTRSRLFEGLLTGVDSFTRSEAAALMVGGRADADDNLAPVVACTPAQPAHDNDNTVPLTTLSVTLSLL
jgi:hypothetical protein